ncbi:MAG: tetratricopeptide repeat protein [Chloroflexota bacterium]
MHNGQVDRAVSQIERAAEIARAVEDRRLQVAIAMLNSRALLFADRADEAIQAAREAVRIAARIDDPQSMHGALSEIAWFYEERGEFDPAREAAERARDLAEQLRHSQGMIWNTNRLGVISFLMGDWARAHTYLDQAMTVARQTGFIGRMPYPHGEGRLLHVHDQLQARTGEPALARSSLDAALAIFQRLGARKDIELVGREIAAVR